MAMLFHTRILVLTTEANLLYLDKIIFPINSCLFYLIERWFTKWLRLKVSDLLFSMTSENMLKNHLHKHLYRTHSIAIEAT